ncbi:MAG: hypothetical protein ACLUNZ_13825 [Evtepia sp.]
MESKNTQPVYSKQQLLTFQRHAARQRRPAGGSAERRRKLYLMTRSGT